MGSKLGFGSLKLDTGLFFRESMTAAKEEFASNFENEENNETGQNWNKVKRDVPPPILNVTGALKDSATREGDIKISGNTSSFEVSAIDSRGKEYASFHEDGENQHVSKEEFQREFVTQSDKLTEKQVNILIKIVDKMFK